jgi:hypothetical protein
MACEPVSNQTKFDFYRAAVEKSLAAAGQLKRFPATDFPGQVRILQRWLHRYQLRYVSVECNATYGTQIADRPAADILNARHAERDSQFEDAGVERKPHLLLRSRVAFRTWRRAGLERQPSLA